MILLTILREKSLIGQLAATSGKKGSSKKGHRIREALF
jgi:hypothetical protein